MKKMGTQCFLPVIGLTGFPSSALGHVDASTISAAGVAESEQEYVLMDHHEASLSNVMSLAMLW